MIEKLDKWHKTKLGLLVFSVLEFVIAYGFFSLSIDRGNFFLYLLCLIFLAGAIKNLIKLTRKVINGHKTAATK